MSWCVCVFHYPFWQRWWPLWFECEFVCMCQLVYFCKWIRMRGTLLTIGLSFSFLFPVNAKTILYTFLHCTHSGPHQYWVRFWWQIAIQPGDTHFDKDNCVPQTAMPLNITENHIRIDGETETAWARLHEISETKKRNNEWPKDENEKKRQQQQQKECEYQHPQLNWCNGKDRDQPEFVENQKRYPMFGKYNQINVIDCVLRLFILLLLFSCKRRLTGVACPLRFR